MYYYCIDWTVAFQFKIELCYVIWELSCLSQKSGATDIISVFIELFILRKPTLVLKFQYLLNCYILYEKNGIFKDILVFIKF